MLNIKSDEAWEKFGRDCPYFGVITRPEYLGNTVEGDTRRQFFASGEADVGSVFNTIHQQLAPGFQPQRALDFGCGVGRIAIPLARRVESVVAVDVSPSMLSEAAKNADEAGITNVEWVRSDDELTGLSGFFDLVHSYIVFQHIEPKRGERILQHMLDKLAKGGIGVTHFTFSNRLPPLKRAGQWVARTIPMAHNLANLARGRSFSYPLMRMNQYDLNRIIGMLADAGCKRVFSLFQDHGGHYSVVLFFQKEP